MTKSELIGFRGKLVWAKEIYIRHSHVFVGVPMRVVGLRSGVDFIVEKNGLPTDWLLFAPIDERIAMWDNSIAHCKKLIGDAK